MTITLAIIIITVGTSLLAFSNQKVTNDLIFHPPAISQHKQWWRFFTCGLIHADVPHLAFNMYSFYMFGEAVENMCTSIFGDKGKLLYLLLYATALGACLLPTYEKHKNDFNYFSLGASGAVSAIIFTGILFFPLSRIGLIFIPGIKIPAFIFGGLYLAITYYLDKRGKGNINHSAHLWGGLYGIAFIIVACYASSDYKVVENFILQVKRW